MTILIIGLRRREDRIIHRDSLSKLCAEDFVFTEGGDSAIVETVRSGHGARIQRQDWRVFVVTIKSFGSRAFMV